jgi:hypothetical protein
LPRELPRSSSPELESAGSSNAYSWSGSPVSDWNVTSTSTVARAGSVTYVLVIRQRPEEAVLTWR